MTARPSKLRLSAPIAASDPVIIGLAGTMLHPDTVFSLLPVDPRAPLVTVDWIAASDKTGLRSVCAALANELTAARAGPIIVIGHSSGGAIALMLALNHPELVSGLLLTNTGANTHGHGDPDAPKRLAAGLTRDIVDKFIDRCFSIAPAPGAAEALRNYALACPDECVVAAMTSQRSIDLAPACRRSPVRSRSCTASATRCGPGCTSMCYSVAWQAQC